MHLIQQAVLDEEPEDGEDLDDDNLLEMWLLPGKESYTDVNITKNLTYQQIRDVQELVQEYADILMERPGITQLEQHHIEMITKDPIKVKSYPMPYAMQEIIKDEVTAMLKADITEPSKSAYCSPVVIVKKKDGFNRFCIEFRKLNLMTKFDRDGEPR